jgi:hypothetical protein
MHFGRESRRLRRMRPKEQAQCAICLKPVRQVRVLVATGSGDLCDECIGSLALFVEEALGREWYRSSASEDE